MQQKLVDPSKAPQGRGWRPRGELSSDPLLGRGPDLYTYFPNKFFLRISRGVTIICKKQNSVHNIQVNLHEDIDFSNNLVINNGVLLCAKVFKLPNLSDYITMQTLLGQPWSRHAAGAKNSEGILYSSKYRKESVTFTWEIKHSLKQT